MKWLRFYFCSFILCKLSFSSTVYECNLHNLINWFNLGPIVSLLVPVPETLFAVNDGRQRMENFFWRQIFELQWNWSDSQNDPFRHCSLLHQLNSSKSLTTGNDSERGRMKSNLNGHKAKLSVFAKRTEFSGNKLNLAREHFYRQSECKRQKKRWFIAKRVVQCSILEPLPGLLLHGQVKTCNLPWKVFQVKSLFALVGSFLHFFCVLAEEVWNSFNEYYIDLKSLQKLNLRL